MLIVTIIICNYYLIITCSLNSIESGLTNFFRIILSVVSSTLPWSLFFKGPLPSQIIYTYYSPYSNYFCP